MSFYPDKLYPEVEPFSTQTLKASPLHTLYVERSGKPGGYPIFFLHGGPGSQTRAGHRRYFDPDFFDIVLFDQRGCGQSIPAGETQDNTTSVLVDDIYLIRQALGITGNISLLGGSWGSTLALAYALRYPDTLDELVLRGVFLGTDDELNWYTQGMRRFAPAAWQAFAHDMAEDLLDSYYQAVFATDLQKAMSAAARWVEYERQLMTIDARSSLASGLTVPSNDLLNRARVQLHYLKHRCFLADRPLLDAASEIQLPVTLVQGALDLLCPPVTACQLSQRLPNARLRMVPDAAHGAMSGSLALALKEECDALRDRLKIRYASGNGYVLRNGYLLRGTT